MLQYYKQLGLALATLMMTTLGLSSCQSKSKDEPIIEKSVAFAAPGGWVNGANGYVEPYHDPAYPTSPYFTREEALAINAKLKSSGSKLYLPSADELAVYFPYYVKVNDRLYLPVSHYYSQDSPNLLVGAEETVQFGRYAKSIQARSTFFTRSVDTGFWSTSIETYAIRFFDQPKHRVFQRWSYSIQEDKEMFGEKRNLFAGTISFLPYEESAAIGGEKAAVFTDEYWKSRISEVKSVTILDWGFDKPGSVYTFAGYGYYHTTSDFYARLTTISGFSLAAGKASSGVIHFFEEGK